MDNKITFLNSAIADTQATIRAIDVKVGTLIVLVLAPFSSLSKIFGHIDNICKSQPQYLWIIVSITFLAMWLLAISTLVRAISAINNPADHIVNSDQYKGSFYGGGMYNFCIIDSLSNRVSIKSAKDISTYYQDIPSSQEDIERELIFEKMKLIYIRDLKAHRLKWGIHFSTAWLVLGSIIFLSSRYIVTNL